MRSAAAVARRSPSGAIASAWRGATWRSRAASCRRSILFTGATASLRGAAFAAAKFGLRGVAQSMARELAPKHIQVAHVIIDGAIDSEAIHRRPSAATGKMPDLPPGGLIQTRSVAEAYWILHNQPRDGWTHELDPRRYSERW
jgi:NAD(P)-dependent dehydrogenase (short-subunit alcohol dehydrogenase family)